MKYHLFLLLALAFLSIECQKNNNPVIADIGNMADNPYHFKAEDASVELTKSEVQMVSGSNSFGYDLAKLILSDLKGGSLVFSPLSVTLVLGMLVEGADDETAEEISRALGFGDKGREQINSFCRNMIVIADHSENTTVKFANAIMLNKGRTMNDGYYKAVTEYYDAKCVSLDFSDETSLDVINKWALEKTNGLIPTILDSINPDAFAYLMDALYFKAAWSTPFKDTESGVKFTKEDGTNSYVEMMYNTDSFYYSQSDAVQVLTLLYDNGAYRLDVLLPQEGKTVMDAINLLGTDDWKTLTSNSQRHDVIVSIPSFSTSSYVDLLSALSSRGIKKAFSNGSFSRLSQDNVNFSFIFQKVKINVDKKGTEAAAITITGDDVATDPSLEAPEPIVFNADKPFVYLITEKTTGAVLFIGTYTGD